MRIIATISERTLRRSFREKRIGRNGLTVIDRDCRSSDSQSPNTAGGHFSFGWNAPSADQRRSSARPTR